MKNTLSSTYEQILLSEAEKHNLQNPSKDTVGSIKPKQDLFGEKPKTVGGPDKAKVDHVKHDETVGSTSKPDAKVSFKGSKPAADPKDHDAEEVEDDEVAPKTEEEKKQKNESVEEPISPFEALFKKTITEELDDVMDDTEEMVSVEDEVEEVEADESEEEDLISDLKHLHDTFSECKEKLASILSKLEDTVEEVDTEESEDDEYSENDFETEFENEEPVKEAVEKPKHLPDAHGKKLMSKSNKVGSLHAKGGKAHTGDAEDDPKPKALGDKKALLQKVKGRPEPKSTVKKGEFFK